MSLSGAGAETNRATLDAVAATGGITEDVERIQATEDRDIVGVHIEDTGGDANVQGELSFSSSHSMGAGQNDNTKASRLAAVGQGAFIPFDVPVQWSAGEELHIHSRNNSGNSESLRVTIYYLEA